MERGTIIMYSIPAYGHINSNLYFLRGLSERGFRILYYSMDRFQVDIERNGCEYRSYPLGQEAIDLTDGSKILRLYHLILTYTRDMLPELKAQAEKEAPCAVVFDSLALWGRIMGELLGVPSYSFYSIAAIDRVLSKGFLAYASGFTAGFLKYAGEIPGALSCRRSLKKKYGISGLDLLHVLMNRGDKNLMGYSQRFQPGGEVFGENYLFLGPMAAYRNTGDTGDSDETLALKGTVIYISLGTVFNQNEGFIKAVFQQLGKTQYQVVMAWDCKEDDRLRIPGNFTVRPFVNQSQVMRRASLFITAGGMNSIHEAILWGVPCLMCPQQGEQLINAKQVERLGFGTVLGEPAGLLAQAEQTMRLKETWNETIRRELTAVHVEKAWELFENPGDSFRR